MSRAAYLVIAAVVASCAHHPPCTESIQARSEGRYPNMDIRAERDAMLTYGDQCKKSCDHGDGAACTEYDMLFADVGDLRDSVLDLEARCDRGEPVACEWVRTHPLEVAKAEHPKDPWAPEEEPDIETRADLLMEVQQKAIDEKYILVASRSLSSPESFSLPVTLHDGDDYMIVVVGDAGGVFNAQFAGVELHQDSPGFATMRIPTITGGDGQSEVVVTGSGAVDVMVFEHRPYSPSGAVP